ncbi:MAG TPA: tRNA guanosine(34) transglycosylase Tgt [Anaeromyxobacteraceae bacterium]|nr:tRNA guanosine(34) transglycosylase Tgt [Anaeromyxobacteraceae bacterium]
MPPSFQVGARDRGSRARRGALLTRHGRVETPAFMPVGTRASVTGLTPEDVAAAGAEIVLGNTYHLLLRPGPDAMRRLGGLHRFMGWERPILTDSGGFQIFSLAADRTVTEQGARFKSYVDQRYHDLSPERSIEVQTALGSDVMMVLDVCLPSTAAPEALREAMERTHRWALRSLAARSDPEQALFAIVQGGLSPALRAASAGFLTGHPFDGFAIGGLAVGDTRDERGAVMAHTTARLPEDRPRYLMGVGTPVDILEAVGLGVDMFDCIIPTTLAWQGTAFTSTGRVRLTRGEHRLSDAPLDAACACPTCRRHPRGYLHHLVKCKEPLGPRLLSVHNLHHYLGLMRDVRAAIEEGRYASFARERIAAVDRHEHDPGARPPGARRGAPAEPRFELVTTRSGAAAVRDRVVGEVMHPVVGPGAEAEALYVGQSRLRERLAAGGDAPLVLLDVGLGAGANALAALRAARGAGPGARRLHVVSLERDTGALALAVSDEGAARLGLPAEDVRAARALLAEGRHEEERAAWLLVLGDAVEALRAWGTGTGTGCGDGSRRSAADPPPPLHGGGGPGRGQGASAHAPLVDLVFWDPFSPRVNPELWTVSAFSALRAACAPRACGFTYSTATSIRSALLLAGFCVGAGDPSGPKEQTTAFACDPADLARPLDRRWLDRVGRSSAPLPAGAPADALDRIRAHRQFG